jgi:hypothetical protein
MNENKDFNAWIEKFPSETKNKLQSGLNKAFDYEPKVAIFGKTGVGVQMHNWEFSTI